MEVDTTTIGNPALTEDTNKTRAGVDTATQPCAFCAKIQRIAPEQRMVYHGVMARRGTRTPLPDIAQMIVLAEVTSVGEASKRTGLPVRSCHDWSQKWRKGEFEELRPYYDSIKLDALKSVSDELERAYLASISRIQSLLGEASMSESLKAAETLGGLRALVDGDS